MNGTDYTYIFEKITPSIYCISKEINPELQYAYEWLMDEISELKQQALTEKQAWPVLYF